MNGGAGLLKKYGGSPTKLLQAVFPNIKFKLQTVPKGTWDSMEYQQKFMDDIGEQLGFKELDDYHYITSKELTKRGGSALLRRYGGSPSKLVRAVYPHFNWISENFNTPRGRQRKLVEKVEVVTSSSKE